MVTADADLVPDDAFGYREALVLAFRRYGVTVPNVVDLSEEALLWSPPEVAGVAIPELAFDRLQHAPHPADDPGVAERTRRADAVGRVVTRPDIAKSFGLRPIARAAADVELPVVESVRALRRVGADGEMRFNIVAEVTQRRRVHLTGGRPYWLHGGSTVVLDADGAVRYAIAKWIDSKSRLDRYAKYVSRLDRETRDLLRAERPSRAGMLRRLHARR
jgi:hypothetical protein